MGNAHGNEGENTEKGDRGSSSAVGVSFIISPAFESVRTVCDSSKGIHELESLRRKDVEFFRGEVQLGGQDRGLAYKVEVRFRGSKGDQGRKGAIMVRTKEGGRWNGEKGGGAEGSVVDC